MMNRAARCDATSAGEDRGTLSPPPYPGQPRAEWGKRKGPLSGSFWQRLCEAFWRWMERSGRLQELARQTGAWDVCGEDGSTNPFG
jgi:hypothetical protein